MLSDVKKLNPFTFWCNSEKKKALTYTKISLLSLKLNSG